MITAEQEMMTFVQHKFPVMNPGTYRLAVTQSIKTKDNEKANDTFTDEKSFGVIAPRFSLQAEDIYSVYPPNGGEGTYQDVLPHVVLTNPMLPWFRRPDGKPTERTEDNVASWLHVLQLDDPSQLHHAGTTTLLDLQHLAQDTAADTFFPAFDLETGQAGDLPCSYIDISVELFKAIMPTVEDLGSLAHIRSVSLDSKATQIATRCRTRQSGDLLVGDFSVVVANKIPQTEGEKTAYLVSLEHFASYLDGEAFPSQAKYVRLVMLHEWQFLVQPKPEVSFTELATQLNDTFTTYSTVRIPGSGIKNETVQTAFEMGYTAMDHQTRLSDEMVSWYRGPLGTYGITPNPFSSISCSDQAARYNPDTGLFDMSESAAWQIGRLAALQNNEFATTLYTWKRDSTQQAIRELEKEMINAYTNSDATHFSRDAFKTRVQQVLSDGEQLQTIAPPDPKAEVLQWLGQLHDLQGIPIGYLIPDERMLPRESIRFFQLNPNWIAALLDGAFSLGRASTSDQTFDRVVTSQLLDKAQQYSGIARKRILRSWLPDEAHINVERGVCSGFILRSELVTGWPGLEAYGFSDDDSKDALELVRFDYLSNDIMIGLFTGEKPLKTLALQEPSEGVIFKCPDHKKHYRYLTNDSGHEAGKRDPDLDPVEVPFRETPDAKGVIDIAALVATMQSTLHDHDLLDKSEALTSDKFALEMVDGVEKVVFKTEEKDGVA